MKLFEIHSKATTDGEGLEFDLIPSPDLAAQLDEPWLFELRERVADVFIDTIKDHAENLNIETATEQLRIVVRLDNQGTLEVRCSLAESFNDMLYEEGIKEQSSKLYDTFIQSVGDAATEYLAGCFKLME